MSESPTPADLPSPERRGFASTEAVGGSAIERRISALESMLNQLEASQRLPDPYSAYFIAKITAFGSGVYSWTEQTLAGSTALGTYTDGRSGNATEGGAISSDGSTTVANGTMVLMVEIEDTAKYRYVFVAPASSGGGGGTLTPRFNGLLYSKQLPYDAGSGDNLAGGGTFNSKFLAGNLPNPGFVDNGSGGSESWCMLGRSVRVNAGGQFRLPTTGGAIAISVQSYYDPNADFLAYFELVVPSEGDLGEADTFPWFLKAEITFADSGTNSSAGGVCAYVAGHCEIGYQTSLGFGTLTAIQVNAAANIINLLGPMGMASLDGAPLAIQINVLDISTSGDFLIDLSSLTIEGLAPPLTT